jgi:murein L,D-transpeptidase YafK
MRSRWILVPVGLATILTVGAVAIYSLRFNSLPPQTTVDRILLEKSARRLTVFHNGQALKWYWVSLGRQPTGPKKFEGDGKTPEGEYCIDWRKEDSSFHLALHVSYPDPSDVAEAEAAGRSPGGAIMIHGIRNGLGFLGPLHRMYDWTNGCIAVTNAEIEELWRAVPNGTRIEIRP